MGIKMNIRTGYRYKTRDGREAEVYFFADEEDSFFGLLDGYERRWDSNGICFHQKHLADLIEELGPIADSVAPVSQESSMYELPNGYLVDLKKVSLIKNFDRYGKIIFILDDECCTFEVTLSQYDAFVEAVKRAKRL